MPNIDGFIKKKSNQHINLMLQQSATKMVIGSLEDCLKEIVKDFSIEVKSYQLKRKILE